jgi:hypothetical protein
MLPDDCEAEEPAWLPVLLCPALLLGVLEVSGDCEDEGVLCATIQAEQANSVKVSKIVFVIGKHSCEFRFGFDDDVDRCLEGLHLRGVVSCSAFAPPSVRPIKLSF